MLYMISCRQPGAARKLKLDEAGRRGLDDNRPHSRDQSTKRVLPLLLCDIIDKELRRSGRHQAGARFMKTGPVPTGRCGGARSNLGVW
jgi:hypothetical protein